MHCIYKCPQPHGRYYNTRCLIEYYSAEYAVIIEGCKFELYACQLLNIHSRKSVVHKETYCIQLG